MLQVSPLSGDVKGVRQGYEDGLLWSAGAMIHGSSISHHECTAGCADEDGPLFSGFTCPTFSMHALNLACACRSCAYEFDRWVSSYEGMQRGRRDGRCQSQPGFARRCSGTDLVELFPDVCELWDVEVCDVDLLRWCRGARRHRCSATSCGPAT